MSAKKPYAIAKHWHAHICSQRKNGKYVMQTDKTPSKYIHQSHAKSPYTVTIIGDIRLDVRTSLASRRFTEIDTDYFERQTIKTALAGTAINFGQAANKQFSNVTVISAIGDDWLTEAVRQSCEKIGLNTKLVVISGQPNGAVVILRDAPTLANARGHRILVSGTPAPNHMLSVSYIEQNADSILSSDALVIDGYSLLATKSNKAILRAAKIAQQNKTCVFFDLVPHDIYRWMTMDDLVPLLNMTDAIIVEIGTLAKLLGLPKSGNVTQDYAIEILNCATGKDIAPDAIWFGRFGIGNMEDTVVYKRDDLSVSYKTGYVNAQDTTAYGDRVAAAELRWLLNRRSSSNNM